MELVSLREQSIDVRMAILKELGYDSDGLFITDENGNKIVDRYTEEPVRIDNMLILPGSEIILDNNPLSIASYLEEFGDVL
jgi:hypothetical protein